MSAYQLYIFQIKVKHLATFFLMKGTMERSFSLVSWYSVFKKINLSGFSIDQMQAT